MVICRRASSFGRLPTYANPGDKSESEKTLEKDHVQCRCEGLFSAIMIFPFPFSFSFSFLSHLDHVGPMEQIGP